MAVVAIVVAIISLVLKQNGNPKSGLTGTEIDALYAINELCDFDRLYCRFELVGESHVSVTLIYRSKVRKEELLDFLDSLVDECKKIDRVDFYFAAQEFDREIVDRLRLLDNISRILVTNLFDEEFSDELDLVCQEMNWQRIYTRIHGKFISLNPEFKVYTNESIRREKLGWWGRLIEDMGL